MLNEQQKERMRELEWSGNISEADKAELEELRKLAETPLETPKSSLWKKIKKLWPTKNPN